jgi:putative nucleotidyltransferase with HDIG domain
VSSKLKEIIEKIADLPSMPDVAFEVMREVDNPTANALTVSNVLARDPSLSARVLQLANSAYYGMPREVASIRGAIVLLGMRTVKSLSLVAATFPWLQKAMQGKGVDPDYLWNHSLAVAFFSRAIARATGTVNPEQAFCIGVLHNLGIVVLCTLKEADVLALAQMQDGSDTPFTIVEESAFGFNHADLGAALVESWNLPEAYSDAIRHHHNPDLATRNVMFADILHLADTLVRNADINEGLGNLVFQVSEHSASRLGLEPDVIEQVAESAFLELNGSGKIFQQVA